MRVDPRLSRYHERADNESVFARDELKKLRLLMRRLRFLEAKVRASGGLAAGDASGGAVFAEAEIDALEYVLTDMEFLETPTR